MEAVQDGEHSRCGAWPSSAQREDVGATGASGERSRNDLQVELRALCALGP